MLCKHEISIESCAECSPRADPRCRWCNRELTDPFSVWLGVGSTCFQHDEKAQAQVLAEARENLGQWYKRGPLLRSSADQWQDALTRLPGVTAAVRTLEDGAHIFYKLDEDGDRRRV